MKEYNWREERKKYRPDFRNEQESEQEQLRKIQTSPSPSSGNKIWMIIVTVLAIIIIFGIFFIVAGNRNSESSIKLTWSEKQPIPPAPAPAPAPPSSGTRIDINIGGDSAAALAKVAEHQKRSVGLVGFCVEFQDGTKQFIPVGTAWAFAPNKFATNAHVALGLRNYAREFSAKPQKPIRSFEVQIVINGTDRLVRPVTHVQIHRDYQLDKSHRNPDVAILTTSGRHDSYFKIAPKSVLHKLKSGTAVAYLGFPMDNLDKNNVHIDNPIASMQTGVIVAVSDFDLKDSGPDKNQWIRHNLPTTGGSSGSPVFNASGEVVAIHSIGSIILMDTKNAKGESNKVPSAVLINGGIRVDMLNGVVPPVPIQEFIR